MPKLSPTRRRIMTSGKEHMNNTPSGDGWRTVCVIYGAMPSPNLISYWNKPVEMWRPEWEEPCIRVFADLHPLTNIHGLWWRPVSKQPDEAQKEHSNDENSNAIKLWCNTHGRNADRCKTEGGIMLPCQIVDCAAAGIEIWDDIVS